MKTLPVALQVFSVRDDAEKDFKGTMQRIKEMGYDGVELAGLYGHTAEQIRKMLDEVGIRAISAHIPYMDLIADTEGIIDQYMAIGCEYIVIPYLNDEYRPGVENFGEVLEAIAKIGAVCKQKGVTLLYHNHDFEFVTMEDGSFGLDYMYSHVSPEYLQTELDCCWVKVAGQDPAAYIRKFAGRCPVVHLKDYRGEKSEHMYELIGLEEDRKDEVKSTFEFRPVGYGVQDMPSILAASVESGADWVVVEQDDSLDRPPMEAAAMSREYLKSLGW